MFKQPDIKSFKHIAVIQTGYIGEIVLSFYLLQKIKDLCPEIMLTFITTKKGIELAQSVSCIDEVIIFDKKGSHKNGRGLRRLAKTIKQSGADCIISLDKPYQATKLVAKSKAKYKIGFDKAALSFLVYNFRQRYHTSYSEIQRNLSLLMGFGLDEINSDVKVQIHFSEQISEEVDTLLHSFISSEYFVVAPGSVWETKRWLPEYFAKLIEMIIQKDGKCILIGSGADVDICKNIEEIVKGNIPEKANLSLLNLAGKTSLLQTLCILKSARQTITNDSAPTHLSELVGTPALTIFGSTSPIFGYAPHLKTSSIAEITELSCRPCEIQGLSKCPKKNFECMEKLLPENIFDKILINY